MCPNPSTVANDIGISNGQGWVPCFMCPLILKFMLIRSVFCENHFASIRVCPQGEDIPTKLKRESVFSSEVIPKSYNSIWQTFHGAEESEVPAHTIFVTFFRRNFTTRCLGFFDFFLIYETINSQRRWATSVRLASLALTVLRHKRGVYTFLLKQCSRQW